MAAGQLLQEHHVGPPAGERDLFVDARADDQPRLGRHGGRHPLRERPDGLALRMAPARDAARIQRGGEQPQRDQPARGSAHPRPAFRLGGDGLGDRQHQQRQRRQQIMRSLARHRAEDGQHREPDQQARAQPAPARLDEDDGQEQGQRQQRHQQRTGVVVDRPCMVFGPAHQVALQHHRTQILPAVVLPGRHRPQGEHREEDHGEHRPAQRAGRAAAQRSVRVAARRQRREQQRKAKPVGALRQGAEPAAQPPERHPAAARQPAAPAAGWLRLRRGHRLARHGVSQAQATRHHAERQQHVRARDPRHAGEQLRAQQPHRPEQRRPAAAQQPPQPVQRQRRQHRRQCRGQPRQAEGGLAREPVEQRGRDVEHGGLVGVGLAEQVRHREVAALGHLAGDLGVAHLPRSEVPGLPQKRQRGEQARGQHQQQIAAQLPFFARRSHPHHPVSGPAVPGPLT
ncbi:MAG: hypothetical protein KatS3mg102_0658 [Planctomycetota bacterium]|nr:MAG: hypothetical protein KatS3mg102_0658 [Planctomycetota bacterium]